MKHPRRKFFRMAAGAAAFCSLSRVASALDYPTRPVRVIVGFPPAGFTDTTTRLISAWLSEKLGQQFVVENRPGAGSNIATEFVAHSEPDGYTLLQIGDGNAYNATLYDNLNFDFVRDIAPVASLVTAPFVLVVNPSFPPRLFQNSLPTPKPIRARSMSARSGRAAPRSSSVSSSSRWRRSILSR